uniref:inner centromere protein-like isoform X2 n=1 Tax=Myxine glutinosa TaxID=7769 RepID=UPI00358E77B6
MDHHRLQDFTELRTLEEYLDEASNFLQQKLHSMQTNHAATLSWLDGIVEEAKQSFTRKDQTFIPKTPLKKKRNRRSRASKARQTRSTKQEARGNCVVQFNGFDDGGTTQADTSLQDHKISTRLALCSGHAVVNPGTDIQEHASVSLNGEVAMGETEQVSRKTSRRAVIRQTSGKQRASQRKKTKQSLAEAKDTALVPAISEEKDVACNASHFAKTHKLDHEYVSKSYLIENNKANVGDGCSTEVQPGFSKDCIVEERVMDWMNNWKVDESKDKVSGADSNGQATAPTEPSHRMDGEESGSNGGGGGADCECAAAITAGEAECGNVENVSKEAECSRVGEKENGDLRSVETQPDGEEREVLAELEIPEETETVAGLPQDEGSNVRLSICRRSSRLGNRSLGACSSLAARISVLWVPGQQNLESRVQPIGRGPAVNDSTPPNELLNVTRSLRKADMVSVLQRKANYQKALQQSKLAGKSGGGIKSLPRSKIQQSPLFSANKFVLAGTHQRPMEWSSSTPQPGSRTPYSFIKDARPKRIDPKEREKEQIENLHKKRMLEEERQKRVIAQRMERLEERKRKNEERFRKAAEVRGKQDMLDIEKKRKMELKLEEQSRKMQVARELDVLQRAKKEKYEKLQERARVATEDCLKKDLEEERQREREKEEERKREELEMENKRQELELERQKRQKLERKKREEFERKKREEFERKKREEFERKKREELERKKREELERKKREELERKKREELERKKMEDLERKKMEDLELERKKMEELELDRKKREELELERKKREELERKKREKLDLERKKREELELEKERRAKEKRREEIERVLMLSQKNPTSQTITNEDGESLLNRTCQNKVTKVLEDYGMDLKSDDSTDDEGKPRKPIPAWAKGSPLEAAVVRSYYNPPDLDSMFLPESLSLEEMFQYRKPRFLKRTSSACWNSPPLFGNQPFTSVMKHRLPDCPGLSK